MGCALRITVRGVRTLPTLSKRGWRERGRGRGREGEREGEREGGREGERERERERGGGGEKVC